jgi:transcriptional regulator with XRE-family HTH domain
MSDGRQPLALDRRIGARVRARRLEIAMSQERLAALLGVTFQQVQKYEKGVNRIAASRLFDISRALDLPVAAFFEEREQRTEDKSKASSLPLEEALAVKGSIELVRLYATFEDKVRRQVLSFVRSMSAEDGA